MPLPRTMDYHPITMRPLLLLSNAFINTFGITQPSPKDERRTAWFIAIMLLLVLAAVATVAAIVLHLAFHH
jgi:hypothetical protein